MHKQPFLPTAILCTLLGFFTAAHAQTFTLAANQVGISVAPSFNHLPIRVAVTTNSPIVNLNDMVVSSDSAWVSPTIDAAHSELVLTFVTSNLVNQLYTATIKVSSWNTTNTLFVKANVALLNITRLKDDPRRSRTYGIQQNGLGLGSVVVIDPITTNCIGNVTAGKKPTDFAFSDDGQEMFVINSVDETISVINLNSLALTNTLTLSAFDNWGQSDTTADIAVGPGNIIYYTDGAWAPALRVLNRTTMQVLQTVYSQGATGEGLGDIGLTSDKKLLYGWMQYGWSAGYAGSYITRFSVATNGLLTFTDAGSSQYNTTFARDPLDTPVLISSDNQTVFIKGYAVSSNSATDVKFTFPTAVYSITPGGEIATTESAVYETASGIKLADLPRSTPVQTISSDYSRLIYFDSSTYEIKVINLLDLIGPGFLNRDVIPADGSITLSPQRLQWTPLPGIDLYHVYLGVSETLVAGADTKSPLFLGAVTQPSISLGALTPGVKYFWRVDAVGQFDITKGDVKEFTVSLISSSTSAINAATVQGHADFKTSFNLNSESSGMAWSVSTDQPWVSFLQNAGITPGTVEVVLNASQLSVGLHLANITISDGTNALFSIPVALKVEPLRLTVMRSDPGSVFVYAVSEDASTIPTQAYLLEINTETESIERVAKVGSSVTDLAIHKGDNRIYVPNWLTGSLLAIDLTTFQQVRAYAFSPYGGMGYSENDIFRVSAGTAGRLIWEEEDQWIDINIFDTVAGTNISRAFVREGGGASGSSGRYYYHGDNNSSGAAIHKYDLVGDHFTELASIRVSSFSYYGSRTVVLSEDGSRVFWNGSAFDAGLAEQWTMADEIYSTSTNGHYAFSQTKIYDVDQKRVLLGMPADTRISAFNSSTEKLVAQVGSSIQCFKITAPFTMPAPVLSAGSITSDSALLEWTDQSLEQSFTLQRRLVGTTNWTDIATPVRNETQYTASGLSPQSAYEFRINADATAANSDWSSIVTVITPGVVPSIPTLNVPIATTESVSLSWSNPTYETGFILERRTGTNGFSLLVTLSADVIAYTDTNVTSGVTYSYRIKATNAAGESDYSVVRTITVAVPTPPSAPSNLIVKVLTANSALLTWRDVSGETGYTVQRRTEDTNSWSGVAVPGANVKSCVVSNLVEGVQYFFRVQAFNGVGESPWSPEVSAIPYDIVRLIEDDFDPSLDPAVWSSITGGVATNGNIGFRGNNALWFSSSEVRQATTVPIDASHGGVIEFVMRAGNETVDGNVLWNNSESGEKVVLEYTKDHGTTWTPIQTLNTVYPSLSDWTTFSVSLPAGALSTQTQLRWRQQSHSGEGYDSWALDDVVVVDASLTPSTPLPPTFIISSATSSASIAVYWSESPDATGYVLERKHSPSPGWITVAVVPASQTYFADSPLEPGTGYTYRVKTIGAQTDSLYSPTTTSVTWTEKQQWLFDIYGDINASPTFGDFDLDGKSDLLLQSTNRFLALWSMDNTTIVSSQLLNDSTQFTAGWRVVATADIDHDGFMDILWQNNSGHLNTWFMRGTNVIRSAMHNKSLPAAWKVMGMADLNQDGNADIVCQHDLGYMVVWLVSGTNSAGGINVTRSVSLPKANASWRIAGFSDFDHNGQTDILYQGSGTRLAIWFMNGTKRTSSVTIDNSLSTVDGWRVVGMADLNGDGFKDILWQKLAGQYTGLTFTWLMNGTNIINSMLLNQGQPAPGWKLVGQK
ncbi:MAG: hypothetical protein JWM68_5125 [Verrucomicrobiales bacterium]|nr:hypothetical protein [Verrucomicrobiales bacterium]